MALQADLLLPRPLLLIMATTGTKRRVRVGELAACVWSAQARKLTRAHLTTVEFPDRYCPAAELLYVSDGAVAGPQTQDSGPGRWPLCDTNSGPLMAGSAHFPNWTATEINAECTTSHNEYRRA